MENNAVPVNKRIFQFDYFGLLSGNLYDESKITVFIHQKIVWFRICIIHGFIINIKHQRGKIKRKLMSGMFVIMR